MEDVMDNVPEVVPEEVKVIPTKMTDDEFINKDHDKSEEVKEEVEKTEEEVEEKVEEEKVDEEVEQAPLAAKDIVAKIKASDPKFFKTHPEVRKAIYESAQYQELFSHPDEAKAVVENYQNFERLATDIMGGKPETLLHTIAQTNKNAVKTFASAFPKALYNQDKQVFYDEIAHPVLTSALNEALASAAKSGNENLKRSIAHLSQFLFDSPTIPQKQKVQEDPEKIELQNRLHQTTVQQYSNIKDEVTGAAYSDIVNTVVKSLPKDINPKMREAYAREVMSSIEETLSNDQNHLRRMNSLWDNLANNGFNPKTRRQIYDAWVNKAKTLLPFIESKVKPQYFGKTVKTDSVVTKPIPPGGVKSSGGTKVNTNQIDWNRTSDMDILNKTPKLRGVK